VSQAHSVAKLIFMAEGGERERQLDEAPDRGYLSHVLVEIDGDRDRLYPVFFYSIGRLERELKVSSEHGQPFIAEIGMMSTVE
jgi:hypothetical protein